MSVSATKGCFRVVVVLSFLCSYCAATPPELLQALSEGNSGEGDDDGTGDRNDDETLW